VWGSAQAEVVDLRPVGDNNLEIGAGARSSAYASTLFCTVLHLAAGSEELLGILHDKLLSKRH